jgi:hypothetical protein
MFPKQPSVEGTAFETGHVAQVNIIEGGHLGFMEMPDRSGNERPKQPLNNEPEGCTLRVNEAHLQRWNPWRRRFDECSVNLPRVSRHILEL